MPDVGVCACVLVCEAGEKLRITVEIGLVTSHFTLLPHLILRPLGPPDVALHKFYAVLDARDEARVAHDIALIPLPDDDLAPGAEAGNLGGLRKLRRLNCPHPRGQRGQGRAQRRVRDRGVVNGGQGRGGRRVRGGRGEDDGADCVWGEQRGWTGRGRRVEEVWVGLICVCPGVLALDLWDKRGHCGRQWRLTDFEQLVIDVDVVRYLAEAVLELPKAADCRVLVLRCRVAVEVVLDPQQAGF